MMVGADSEIVRPSSRRAIFMVKIPLKVADFSRNRLHWLQICSRFITRHDCLFYLLGEVHCVQDRTFIVTIDSNITWPRDKPLTQHVAVVDYVLWEPQY